MYNCLAITMCFYRLPMPLLNVFKNQIGLKGALMTLGHAMGFSQFVIYTASERHTSKRKLSLKYNHSETMQKLF